MERQEGEIKPFEMGKTGSRLHNGLSTYLRHSSIEQLQREQVLRSTGLCSTIEIKEKMFDEYEKL